jgi:hypothetical protein
MAKVVLAPQLARWLPQGGPDSGESALEIAGGDLLEVLEGLFARHPVLRGYVLDERGALRRHVALFLDGQAVPHRGELRRPVGGDAEIYVMQALSGG